MFRRNSAIFMVFVHQYLKLTGIYHNGNTYYIVQEQLHNRTSGEFPPTHSTATHSTGTRQAYIMDQEYGEMFLLTDGTCTQAFSHI
jgi:hypothetical protein